VDSAESTAGLPASPECPFCGARETELANAFGSQLSVAAYWCRPCRSPFEVMKRVAAPSTVSGHSGQRGSGSAHRVEVESQ
jgi:hypothetical protein